MFLAARQSGPAGVWQRLDANTVLSAPLGSGGTRQVAGERPGSPATRIADVGVDHVEDRPPRRRRPSRPVKGRSEHPNDLRRGLESGTDSACTFVRSSWPFGHEQHRDVLLHSTDQVHAVEVVDLEPSPAVATRRMLGRLVRAGAGRVRPTRLTVGRQTLRRHGHRMLSGPATCVEGILTNIGSLLIVG